MYLSTSTSKNQDFNDSFQLNIETFHWNYCYYIPFRFLQKNLRSRVSTLYLRQWFNLYFSFKLSFKDKSFSCAVSTGPGASVNGSDAEAVFGKRMVSRKFVFPARSITSRSNPSAIPPCGGVPYSRACSKKPNCSSASSFKKPNT